MKKSYLYLGFVIAIQWCLLGCNRVSEDESNFDNVVYIQQASIRDTETVMVSVDALSLERTMQAALALPMERDVSVACRADFSLVDRYNVLNQTNCEALDEQFFEIPERTAVITAGNVRSSNVSIRFKNLENLPGRISFILPVTLESAEGVDILEGSKTFYFVLKKGAPIIVAANIANTGLELIDDQKSRQDGHFNNISQITLECLIRIHNWDGDENIQTIMGSEAVFLLRVGDSAWPREQIQFAGSGRSSGLGGKWPPPSQAKKLEPMKWHHVAFTFDLVTREAHIYVDGKVQSRDFLPGTYTWVNLNNVPGSQGASYDGKFYIGYSYRIGRELKGEISETRVWRTIRTRSQINESMYGENVEAGMTGLVAWWRFNEGEGNIVFDHSGNGHDLRVMNFPSGDNAGQPRADIVWVPVELGLEEE